MKPPTLDRHFRAIWRRASNATLGDLTPDLISGWAAERGLHDVSTEEKAVGLFGRISAVVLTANGAKACFPKIPATGDEAWWLRRERADREAAIWAKMEWFSPFWLSRRDTGRMVVEATHCSKKRAVEVFNYHTVDDLHAGLPGSLYRADDAGRSQSQGLLPARAGGLSGILQRLSRIEHLGAHPRDRR